MDVVPHCGIDQIRLGASRESIVEMLGDADKKTRDYHEDGEHSEIWIYRLLRLELSFDSEHDFQLSHVTSYHPYTLVRSFNPIGLEEKFLLQKFPHLDLDVEISDGEKYFTDRVLDLTFGTARGKVVSVTVFPEYDGDGSRVIWPS
jgi:hypothetical protein